MDAKLAAVLSLIPERVARLHAGTAFVLPDASACIYPERVAHVARFLHWMSPLDRLSKDDQRTLGLVAANGRPVVAADMEELPEEATGVEAGEEAGEEATEEEVIEEEVIEEGAVEEDFDAEAKYERQGSLGTQIAP